MKSPRPKAEPTTTTEFCFYGCNTVAKFKFSNGRYCCSAHQNSCQGKRKQFSDRTDHKETASRSLATRTKLGITKSSQIKGGVTRVASGHYQRLAEKMKEHWAEHPWQNNIQCPLLPYKGTTLNYQGLHEYNFLENLENKNGIDWISNNVSRGPSIWYIDPTDSTKRLYISDFLVDNTIYEIKSEWTWNRNGEDMALENKNKAKLNECIMQGFSVILVLNGKEIIYEK
jgi:hypothetical protein